jgi:hypothetical protein
MIQLTFATVCPRNLAGWPRKGRQNEVIAYIADSYIHILSE